jgi:hypothetical protein
MGLKSRETQAQEERALCRFKKLSVQIQCKKEIKISEGYFLLN